jgi:hypothetical protein
LPSGHNRRRVSSVVYAALVLLQFFFPVPRQSFILGRMNTRASMGVSAVG